jgi:hypothetical protein
MPMPMMPKRTRSLGATDWAAANDGSDSRKIDPGTNEAPAAPAVVCRNCRREKKALFMISILSMGRFDLVPRSCAQFAESQNAFAAYLSCLPVVGLTHAAGHSLIHPKELIRNEIFVASLNKTWAILFGWRATLGCDKNDRLRNKDTSIAISH